MGTTSSNSHSAVAKHVPDIAGIVEGYSPDTSFDLCSIKNKDRQEALRKFHSLPFQGYPSKTHRFNYYLLVKEHISCEDQRNLLTNGIWEHFAEFLGLDPKKPSKSKTTFFCQAKKKDLCQLEYDAERLEENCLSFKEWKKLVSSYCLSTPDCDFKLLKELDRFGVPRKFYCAFNRTFHKLYSNNRTFQNFSFSLLTSAKTEKEKLLAGEVFKQYLIDQFSRFGHDFRRYIEGLEFSDILVCEYKVLCVPKRGHCYEYDYNEHSVKSYDCSPCKQAKSCSPCKPIHKPRKTKYKHTHDNSYDPWDPCKNCDPTKPCDHEYASYPDKPHSKNTESTKFHDDNSDSYSDHDDYGKTPVSVSSTGKNSKDLVDSITSTSAFELPCTPVGCQYTCEFIENILLKLFTSSVLRHFTSRFCFTPIPHKTEIECCLTPDQAVTILCAKSLAEIVKKPFQGKLVAKHADDHYVVTTIDRTLESDCWQLFLCDVGELLHSKAQDCAVNPDHPNLTGVDRKLFRALYDCSRSFMICAIALSYEDCGVNCEHLKKLICAHLANNCKLAEKLKKQSCRIVITGH